MNARQRERQERRESVRDFWLGSLLLTALAVASWFALR